MDYRETNKRKSNKGGAVFPGSDTIISANTQTEQ